MLINPSNERDMDRNTNEMTDRFGAVASTLCAIHCALCALLPAVFTAVGLGMLLSHEAEWGLTLVAVSFGVAAFWYGWRAHRRAHVAALLGLGIVGLLASRGLEMAVPHDDHHGEEHHAAEDEHEDEHDDEHNEEHDDESMHLVGAGVGVTSGLLLCIGHLMNLRSIRRRRDGELT